MTPEHNDALHRVQRAHPNVRWVEEDGSVILYREDSKRFIYLVLGGSLIEEDAMVALAELNAELAGAPAEPEPEPVVTVSKRAKAKPADEVPEESPPEHVTEGEG